MHRAPFVVLTWGAPRLTQAPPFGTDAPELGVVGGDNFRRVNCGKNSAP